MMHVVCQGSGRGVPVPNGPGGTGETDSDKGPMVTHSKDAMAKLLEAVTEPVEVVIRWV